MGRYSFREDARISSWQRERLRDFCSTLERNIVALANEFGLKVFEEDLLPYERGYLQKTPSCGSASGWVIKINKGDRPETKNFTVGHEIGHFVLHGPQLVGLDQLDGRMNRDTSEGSVDPFSYLDKRDLSLEAEANLFAAALLMPQNLFSPAYLRLNGDIRALANLFVVSEGAVARRIKELRLQK